MNCTEQSLFTHVYELLQNSEGKNTLQLTELIFVAAILAFLIIKKLLSLNLFKK